MPRSEHVDERIAYHAHLKPTDRFSVGPNPLVAAASELLSCVVGLRHSMAEYDLPVLHARLSAGVNAFEANALYSGCERGQVMSARYVLCTVLDEAISTSEWGNENDGPPKSLSSRFHNETLGGANVFQLIDRLCLEPAKNLYLLELLYVSLSLGFEGRFHVKRGGALEREAIRDSLYRQIRHVRGDMIRDASPHCQGLKARRGHRVRIVPRWLLVTLTLGCLTVMYSGFAWVLSQQREAVMQHYEQHAAEDQAAAVNRKS